MARDFQLLNYQITKLHICRYAEAVVGVLEIWRDAGAGGAARYFDVVSPGSAAGGFALARFGAARVAIGRHGVVTGVVPVAAPFVDVFANVIQAEGIGSVASHRLRAGLPARGIVGERLRRGIAPRESLLLEAAAGGQFPFRFGRQAVGTANLRTEPLAVSSGFEPRDASHRLLGIGKVGIREEGRRLRRRRAEKVFVFGIGDLRGGEPERVNPDPMNWTFAVLSGGRAHQEPGGGNLDE